MIAKNATTLTRMNAIQRKKRTMKWGIASSHLTSQSPRLSRGESSPVSRSGYGGGLVSICRTSLSPDSGDGYRWGLGNVLAPLWLCAQARHPFKPAGQVAVPVAKQLHRRGQQ